MSKYDPIIYGKSDIEKIVSIEIHDGIARLFIENPDEIIIQDIPSKPWVLSHRQLDKSMIELKGSQYFKYGKQFPTLAEFNKFKHNNYLRDIYTIHNLKENCMINKGLTYFKGMKIEDVSVLSFDIETNGLKMDSTSKVFLISNTYKKNNKIIKKLFSVDEYESEAEMVNEWCKWVCDVNPSILLGHNILSYDLPFLHHIITREGHEGLTLGRDGSLLSFNEKESRFRVDGNRDLHYNKSVVYGRELIDTMFLAYRYDIGRKYESYGLKPIIKQEGLEDSNRTFYDASKIKDNWHNKEEREKIKAYAIDDADDSLKLFYLMAPSVFYMTQSVPKPFQLMTESATGSQLNAIMVRAYLQQGHSIAKADDVEQFEGGISFGVPGIYRNVEKWDIVSAYPSVIIGKQLCDTKKDPYKYFPYIVSFFKSERIKNKGLSKETGEKYYEDLQSSQKVFINSSFGLCGTGGLNYNCPRIAAEITRTTRQTIERALLWASGEDRDFWQKKFNEGVYGEDEE